MDQNVKCIELELELKFKNRGEWAWTRTVEWEWNSKNELQKSRDGKGLDASAGSRQAGRAWNGPVLTFNSRVNRVRRVELEDEFIILSFKYNPEYDHT